MRRRNPAPFTMMNMKNVGSTCLYHVIYISCCFMAFSIYRYYIDIETLPIEIKELPKLVRTSLKMNELPKQVQASLQKRPERNTDESFAQNGLSAALTGTLFSGEIVRTSLPEAYKNKHKYLAKLDNMPACDNWAVVTTVFSPSKAVQHIASLTNWCLVIVADMKTPPESKYLFEMGNVNHITRKRVKYLSVPEQSKLYPLLAEAIPLNTFGRKNIGYMYAIHHEANYIWDFDDDNFGLIELNDFKPSNPLSYVTDCKAAHNTLLNPYPYFGVAESYTWPRGFPLQDIKNKTTLPKLCTKSTSVKLGIVQSLANKQPDIDAIYRLTRDIPFNFRATPKSHRPLVLPRNSYTPFNAQATLWFAPAFPYLLLPISVHGRVSDIWRSYIAEYFLYKNDLLLAFSSPYVVQDRNPHNYLRDFNAELDLYQKSKQLVEFLSSDKHGNQPHLLAMYKSLYMREYFELPDIFLAEAWTKTLEDISK
ncbi:probable glycosyltransferase STELLO2 isoform X3 [Pecten maximus]|uniref:probable glycosyltransferase STELLO2 isoform X2 n=1 Tax=Pecten maximus TaxID=6579 RepID=UPI0014582C46|nr:probable glycosyltransferase STELLO2 isoform X2 [Pecten maximus]XP_033743588.1 probable glycosyltransferase STELLO2 isoform X3 [Pecten maximus]